MLWPVHGGHAERCQKNKRNIAILTQHTLFSHNFDVFFLTGFTDQIRRSGYTMRMFEAVKEELTAGQLPPQPDLSDAAAIFCIGLFDLAYLNKVACWDSPCVIVDGCAGASNSLLCYDLISMESHDRTHDFRGREANRLRRL